MIKTLKDLVDLGEYKEKYTQTHHSKPAGNQKLRRNLEGSQKTTKTLHTEEQIQELQQDSLQKLCSPEGKGMISLKY